MKKLFVFFALLLAISCITKPVHAIENASDATLIWGAAYLTCAGIEWASESRMAYWGWGDTDTDHALRIILHLGLATALPDHYRNVYFALGTGGSLGRMSASSRTIYVPVYMRHF